MERVTEQNIQKFYEGSKIFHISQMDGKESIYHYIMTDGDYIVVRELDLLALLSEQWGDITYLVERQIFNSYFYFFDEKQVLEKQIEWHQNQINRLQNKIDTIYCD